MSHTGEGRRARTLTAIRAVFLLGAPACLALPFFGEPGAVTATGLEVLSLTAGTPSALGPVTVLLLCAAALTLVHRRRPSVLVLLGTLLTTLLATGLVIQKQRALSAVFPGQYLPGYWIVLALLVGSLITVLADLLYRDVRDDIAGPASAPPEEER